MTLTKLLKMYEHYKNYYDFRLKKISYCELEEKINSEGEWLKD